MFNRKVIIETASNIVEGERSFTICGYPGDFVAKVQDKPCVLRQIFAGNEVEFVSCDLENIPEGKKEVMISGNNISQTCCYIK